MNIYIYTNHQYLGEYNPTPCSSLYHARTILKRKDCRTLRSTVVSAEVLRQFFEHPSGSIGSSIIRYTYGMWQNRYCEPTQLRYEHMPSHYSSTIFHHYNGQHPLFGIIVHLTIRIHLEHLHQGHEIKQEAIMKTISDLLRSQVLLPIWPLR